MTFQALRKKNKRNYYNCRTRVETSPLENLIHSKSISRKRKKKHCTTYQAVLS